ncbi:MAG: hypothetical protein IPL23_15590 [Saprospiraceae bacterium]|nr:hypothetical protein [Saprospiraceae bacterium]
MNTPIDEKIKAKFDNLPTRQHVRIDHKGVAINGGLFDNEVVFKGTRFKFEIELIGNEGDKVIWDEILCEISEPTVPYRARYKKWIWQPKSISIKIQNI